MKDYAELELAEFPFPIPDATAMRGLMREARATGPLARGGIGPLVVRHAAVNELIRDRRLRGPGMDLARISGIPEGSRSWRRQQKVLLFMEGEDHHRLRRLVAKAFTPRAVDALRPYTRSVIRELVDNVYAQGRCDAIASLTNPFPIPVISALIASKPTASTT